MELGIVSLGDLQRDPATGRAHRPVDRMAAILSYAVQVYEDFATVDVISRGRAEIIAGRRAFVEPFALFGYDTADYDRLFAEKLG